MAVLAALVSNSTSSESVVYIVLAVCYEITAMEAFAFLNFFAGKFS